MQLVPVKTLESILEVDASARALAQTVIQQH
jgi:hypothetical protein